VNFKSPCPKESAFIPLTSSGEPVAKLPPLREKKDLQQAHQDRKYSQEQNSHSRTISMSSI